MYRLDWTLQARRRQERMSVGATAAAYGHALDVVSPPLGDQLPAGCATDAIKLFAGNIPKSYGEEELLAVFEKAGKVVELIMLRDKATHESKGSAFIW